MTQPEGEAQLTALASEYVGPESEWNRTLDYVLAHAAAMKLVRAAYALRDEEVRRAANDFASGRISSGKLAELLHCDDKHEFKTAAHAFCDYADLKAEVAHLQREQARLIIERDSAREQFDKHVAWASDQLAEAEAARTAAEWRNAKYEATLTTIASQGYSTPAHLAREALKLRAEVGDGSANR